MASVAKSTKLDLQEEDWVVKSDKKRNILVPASLLMLSVSGVQRRGKGSGSLGI